MQFMVSILCAVGFGPWPVSYWLYAFALHDVENPQNPNNNVVLYDAI